LDLGLTEGFVRIDFLAKRHRILGGDVVHIKSHRFNGGAAFVVEGNLNLGNAERIGPPVDECAGERSLAACCFYQARIYNFDIFFGLAIPTRDYTQSYASSNESED